MLAIGKIFINTLYTILTVEQFYGLSIASSNY